MGSPKTQVYTTMYTLDKGAAANLDKPVILIQNKRFRLSYAEMTKHCLRIDMWKVSTFPGLGEMLIQSALYGTNISGTFEVSHYF